MNNLDQPELSRGQYCAAQIKAHPEMTEREIATMVDAHVEGAAEEQRRAIGSYWLLQIVAGQVVLRGPFVSDEEREHEFDMSLIDPGNEYLVHIDPTPKPAYAWLPSKEYIRERKLYIDNIPD